MSRRSEETFSQRRHVGGQQACEKMLSITNHHQSEIQPHACWNDIIIIIEEITSTGEDAEKREQWYTIGRDVNLCSHYGK